MGDRICPVDTSSEGKPSLRGAKLRSARAAHHLAELERALGETAASGVTLDRRDVQGSEEPRITLDWSQSKRPSTAWIAIVSGEVLYNLRTALDYLVYALARLDSGRSQAGTSFRSQTRRRNGEVRNANAWLASTPSTDKRSSDFNPSRAATGPPSFAISAIPTNTGL